MRRTTGFIIGKFMPPTLGHVYLCQFAQNYCDDLTIMVESQDGQPIDGFLRLRWMQEMFPRARVVHCHETLPQDPAETPYFWDIWADVVKHYAPEVTDFVFASEAYGVEIAKILGASFVPVDVARQCRPISATMVRENPFAHWDMLPEPVRAHYCKRIVLMGPESSGKTTLANALGQALRTTVAPEYGRTYCDFFGEPDEDGLRKIARGHLAGTTSAMRFANRILVEDTDAAMTLVWADMFGIARDPEIEAMWAAPDLYVVCDIDVPWISDGQRWFPEAAQRAAFLDRCISEARSSGTPYVLASGSLQKRLVTVLKSIERRLPDAYKSMCGKKVRHND